jgi:hypothetical protein
MTPLPGGESLLSDRTGMNLFPVLERQCLLLAPDAFAQ